MHLTIERYLESEARAAGIPFPMIKRDDKGRFGLFATSDTLGANPQLVERFTDHQDALSRIGHVAAAYADVGGAS